MPTLTAHSDFAPQPRVDVEILAGEIDPAAMTLTVIQVSDVGEVEVRDGIDRSAAGGVFVTDFEVPWGRVVTYQARQYDADGAFIGTTASADVTVTVDERIVCFSDPFAPARAVGVRAGRGFASDLVEPREVQRYQVGRSAIALMSEVMPLSGVPLDVVTLTNGEAAQLREVLQQGLVLVRSMPQLGLPGLLFCVVGGVSRRLVGLPAGGEHRVWPLVGDEVQRPLLSTIEPAVTWQRYVDAFVTWQDMIDAYPTWFDAISNPPPEA